MNEPGVEPTIIESTTIEINGLTKTYQVGDVPVHALREAPILIYGSGSLWGL